MKLKIEKTFTDKHTGEKYKVGDVKDFEKKRAEELLADSRNLVSKFEVEKQETVVEPIEETAAEDKPKAKRVKK